MGTGIIRSDQAVRIVGQAEAMPADGGLLDADLSARARARVGTLLRNKWRLDELLGVGGMAAVYAATHRNGARAAVKVLHVELTTSVEARRRFAREGYVANAVAHEGVVRVLDDDVSEDGAIFLVTELLAGETLEQRRERLGGRLPEDEVLAAIDQVLDALAAAHAKGVVHRDIKPENLFLTPTGQVKVLDFGIARMRELSTRGHATRFGESMGTPAFMPPEQARGRWDEVDAQSDLWACGATMFTLLSGEVVNVGPTVNEALLAAMTQSARPLASVAPEVSPAVAALVDRALASEKADRWPDARAMQESVRSAYVARHNAPITTAPKLIPPEDPTRAGRTTAGSATAEPVARTGDDAESPTFGRARVALVVGGVVLAGVGLLLLTKARGTVPLDSAPRASGASAAPMVPSVPPPPEPVALAPAPSDNAPPVPPDVHGKGPTAPQSGKASAPCTPPFTIDAASGKKRWKRDCL
jgi:serine/threonine-protein kinase